MMLTSKKLATAALLGVAHAIPFHGIHYRRAELLDSYDYVIVGAGASGLTVANRLSEDSSVTVLIIESGDFDQNEDFMTIPGLAGGAIGTKYDWNTTYAPNPQLLNRSVSIPQGRVVGGSTKLNRMVFDRGSQSDFDRWAQLGNTGWDYDGLLPYLKKQENFTPPIDEIVAKYGVHYDSSAHGTSGPISVTYSPFFWPLTQNIINATKELGIETPIDQAAGEPIGGYFCPHNQYPTNATRCSAREAYYNPVANSRTNLHLATGQQVTRLISNSTNNGTVQISAVEYAISSNATRSTVDVKKEAILAAGSLFSPQILQVSGIGASSLLDEIGVTTLVDLPAVGQNFEDHVLLSTVASVTTSEITSANLTNNATFAAEALAEYRANATGPYSTATGDWLLFVPLSSFANTSSTIAAQAAAQNGSQYLPADAPPEVIGGYTKQQVVLNDNLLANDSAILELIWDTGTIALGLEHPYSRGSVKAASSSTFDAPIASPGYLSNPLDLAILVEAVKFTRTVRKTAAIKSLQPVEILPGVDVTSNADIEAFIREKSATLYHPTGSCKMGPREEGGVVDTKLKVYGTSNLRVVDASMIPLLPASHIMATVFGVAEKAADIIKGAA